MAGRDGPLPCGAKDPAGAALPEGAAEALPCAQT